MQRVLLFLGAIIFFFIISADKNWQHFDNVLTVTLISYIVLWASFLVFVAFNKEKKSADGSPNSKKHVQHSLAKMGFGFFGSALYRYFDRDNLK